MVTATPGFLSRGWNHFVFASKFRCPLCVMTASRSPSGFPPFRRALLLSSGLGQDAPQPACRVPRPRVFGSHIGGVAVRSPLGRTPRLTRCTSDGAITDVIGERVASLCWRRIPCSCYLALRMMRERLLPVLASRGARPKGCCQSGPAARATMGCCPSAARHLQIHMIQSAARRGAWLYASQFP